MKKIDIWKGRSGGVWYVTRLLKEHKTGVITTTKGFSTKIKATKYANTFKKKKK